MQISNLFSNADNGLGPRVKEVTLSDRERLFFLMGMMFKSGQTTVEALRTVSKAFKQEGNEDIAGALTGISQKVAQGRPMSRAVESEPILFNEIHRAALMAGESANKMKEAFEILRMLEDKKIQASRSGMGELLTPMALLVMSLASLFNTGLRTLPIMSELKEAQGKQLPFLPRSVMGFTNTVADNWHFVLAFIIVLVVGVYSFAQSPQGKRTVHGWFLVTPILGKFIAYDIYSKMLLYFPHLIASGVKPKQMVPIMEALSTNLVLRTRIDMFNQTINTGGRLSQAMEKAGFPSIAVTPVSVSEHYTSTDKNPVNDVMIEGMGHAYSIMERILTDTHKKFISTSSGILWVMGGSVMMIEMVSIVLTQA